MDDYIMVWSRRDISPALELLRVVSVDFVGLRVLVDMIELITAAKEIHQFGLP